MDAYKSLDSESSSGHGPMPSKFSWTGIRGYLGQKAVARAVRKAKPAVAAFQQNLDSHFFTEHKAEHLAALREFAKLVEFSKELGIGARTATSGASLFLESETVRSSSFTRLDDETAIVAKQLNGIHQAVYLAAPAVPYTSAFKALKNAQSEIDQFLKDNKSAKILPDETHIKSIIKSAVVQRHINDQLRTFHVLADPATASASQLIESRVHPAVVKIENDVGILTPTLRFIRTRHLDASVAINAVAQERLNGMTKAFANVPEITHERGLTTLMSTFRHAIRIDARNSVHSIKTRAKTKVVDLDGKTGLDNLLGIDRSGEVAKLYRQVAVELVRKVRSRKTAFVKASLADPGDAIRNLADDRVFGFGYTQGVLGALPGPLKNLRSQFFGKTRDWLGRTGGEWLKATRDISTTTLREARAVNDLVAKLDPRMEAPRARIRQSLRELNLDSKYCP